MLLTYARQLKFFQDDGSCYWGGWERECHPNCTNNATNYKVVEKLLMQKETIVILDTLCSPLHWFNIERFRKEITTPSWQYLMVRKSQFTFMKLLL